jgi:hypothetical protein
MNLQERIAEWEQWNDQNYRWALADIILPELKAAYDAALTERDNLQHLLTKYEALETAAEKFYGPSKGHRWLPGEALAELLEDAAKWRAIANQEVRDWSETDTQVRESCAKVLSHEQVYGSTDGVPGVADLVDLLVARVAELKALVNELGRSGAENARRAGEAEGKATGLEWRVKELEAEVARLREQL